MPRCQVPFAKALVLAASRRPRCPLEWHIDSQRTRQSQSAALQYVHHTFWSRWSIPPTVWSRITQRQT